MPDDTKAPASSKGQRLVAYLRSHVYMVIVLILLLWMAFFDDDSLLSLYASHRQLEQLQERCEYYREKIQQDSLRKLELETDPVRLEKFAREQYYMHREGEDVFVVREQE